MRRSERESADPIVRGRYDRVWPADGRAEGEPDPPPWHSVTGGSPEPRDERLWPDLAAFGDPWDIGPDAERAGRPAARDEVPGWPAARDEAPGRPAARDDVAGWAPVRHDAPGWPAAGDGPAQRPGGGGPVPPPGARALAALNPGRRGIKALAALAVVVALVAGFLAWRSQPHAVAVPPLATPPVATPPAAAGTPAGSPSPTTTLLVVAVEGRVRHPGLVRLPPGSRVADALAAAGGALPGTDLSFVNLARKVVDGELIVIGMTPPPGTQTGDATAPGVPAPGGIVDLNTATAADLDTLPGIGPALAQRILDYRTQHGGFRTVDELRNVPGIGDAKFAEVKDLVTV